MTKKQSSKKNGLTQEQVFLLSIYFRCHYLWERLSLYQRELKLSTDKEILCHIAAFKKEFVSDIDSVKSGENIKWTFFDRKNLVPVNIEYVSIVHVFDKADKKRESYKLAMRAMVVLESLYAIERQFRKYRNDTEIRIMVDDFQKQIDPLKRDLLQLSSEAIIEKTIFEETEGLPEIPLSNTADMPKENLALATLSKHPDWKDKEIAKYIGVSRTTLYDMKTFKAAKEILKHNKRDIAKGFKYNQRLEAVDD